MTMAFVSVLSTLLHRTPEVTAKAGIVPASWLAPIFAIVPIFTIAWVMHKLMAGRKEGEGLADIFINILGTGLGKLLAIVFALWAIYYAGLILRSGGERFVSTVYRSRGPALFIIVTAIIALIGASGKLTALGSCAEIFVLFTVGIFLVFICFLTGDVRTENLLPVSYMDTVPVLKASLPSTWAISPFVFLYFLAGKVRTEERALKVTLRWLTSIIVLTLALHIIAFGSFGTRLTAEIQSAFFALARNISIFGTVRRIESVVVGVWVAADFVMIGSMIMVASEIITVVFRLNSRKALNIIIGIAITIVGFLCAENAFVLDQVFEKIVPIATVLLIYTVMPLLFIVGRLRKCL